MDKSLQKRLDIPYVVGYDDVAIGPGDIPLADSKTHQFFAFAGTVFPDGAFYQIYPFNEPGRIQPLVLPLWVTLDDVVRAAHASAQATGVAFAEADVPANTLLDKSDGLDGHWLRITGDAQRLPIRMAQSLRPIHWDLQAVPPGVYTIAGYVFSPPYNDWSIRPGVIKVKDAEHDVPAATITAIVESVFAYEGRRVSGCLDVPAGTRLNAYYRFEEHPELGWRAWAKDQPAQSGPFELCFHADEHELSGALRLRIDLTAPDGTVTSVHSRDTLTWLRGQGACTESDTKCCGFEGAAVTTSTGGAELDADASTTITTTMSTTMQPRRHRGCGVAPAGQSNAPGPVWACLATWWLRRRRSYGPR